MTPAASAPASSASRVTRKPPVGRARTTSTATSNDSATASRATSSDAPARARATWAARRASAWRSDGAQSPATTPSLPSQMASTVAAASGAGERRDDEPVGPEAARGA